MELRQKLIELLNEVLDTNRKNLSKKLLEHKKDRAAIYEEAYANLNCDIDWLIYELEEGKKGK